MFLMFMFFKSDFLGVQAKNNFFLNHQSRCFSYFKIQGSSQSYKLSAYKINMVKNRTVNLFVKNLSTMIAL